jgi:sn-glycerol 3-phosphate transport system permease protein
MAIDQAPVPAGTPEAPASPHASRGRRRRRWRLLGSYTGLIIGALIVLFPLYIAVNDSLLTPSQILASPPPLFPTDPQWHNYVEAFSTYGFASYLRNSFIQSGLIVFGALTTSILAAYAFVFLKFPFRRTLFVLVLATAMIPFEVTVAANYDTVFKLHWQGNFAGLTIPFMATGFGIFLLRQSFMGIPKELREAALIDGYGPIGFLWRVALPLARPVIAALAVFSFLGAWNQYLWPDLLTSNNQSIRTVQIGLKVIGGTIATVGVSLAAAVITLIPLVILLVFFLKNLVRALTAGAVK